MVVPAWLIPTKSQVRILPPLTERESMFSFNDIERIKVDEFIETHKCTITYEGAIGGKISYIFTPTSLGIAKSVECACGQKSNVTDYSDW